MSKLLQESGYFSSLFSRNPAKLADVWCLELCAGTLFVLLLKFGAVLSIICGYEWLFDSGFLVGGIDCSVLLSCVFFLRLLKLHKLTVRKLDLSRGGLTLCHSVLDHGWNLRRNIRLRWILVLPWLVMANESKDKISFSCNFCFT